mmetsp:Transcript_147/g.403  ORF Transcript_147/g.403 Transcript_147/m.403 type:complete len:213 (+) Transcript_147:2734-3372(+)
MKCTRSGLNRSRCRCRATSSSASSTRWSRRQRTMHSSLCTAGTPHSEGVGRWMESILLRPPVSPAAAAAPPPSGLELEAKMPWRCAMRPSSRRVARGCEELSRCRAVGRWLAPREAFLGTTGSFIVWGPRIPGASMLAAPLPMNCSSCAIWITSCMLSDASACRMLLLACELSKKGKWRNENLWLKSWGSMRFWRQIMYWLNASNFSLMRSL